MGAGVTPDLGMLGTLCWEASGMERPLTLGPVPGSYLWDRLGGTLSGVGPSLAKGRDVPFLLQGPLPGKKQWR